MERTLDAAKSSPLFKGNIAFEHDQDLVDNVLDLAKTVESRSGECQLGVGSCIRKNGVAILCQPLPNFTPLLYLHSMDPIVSITGLLKDLLWTISIRNGTQWWPAIAFVYQMTLPFQLDRDMSESDKQLRNSERALRAICKKTSTNRPQKYDALTSLWTRRLGNGAEDRHIAVSWLFAAWYDTSCAGVYAASYWDHPCQEIGWQSPVLFAQKIDQRMLHVLRQILSWR